MNLRNYYGPEPDVWFLVFKKKTPHRWLSWLAMGRFKHVFAIGWVQQHKTWLLYEVSLRSTTVAMLPDCENTNLALEAIRHDAVTLAVMRQPERRRWFRFGFWCVPAMAHLVNLPCAVRPDGLFRQCLRHNAEVVDYGLYETLEQTSGSGTG